MGSRFSATFKGPARDHDCPEGVENGFSKVVILGDVRTGKTSLVQQLVRQRFTSQYRATIGADFDVKEVRCGEQNVSLQIWDSPGDDRYCDIGKSFWRGAHMCLLVYDITNQASFQNLGHWVDLFRSDQPHTPLCVIGNKSDKRHHQETESYVTEESAKLWCDELSRSLQSRVRYFETSANDFSSVQKAFHDIACAMHGRSNDNLVATKPTKSAAAKTPARACECNPHET